VYVTDRSSHRIESFDENGRFLDQFSTGSPSTPQVLFLSEDKNFWIADNMTSKIVKYDVGGHYDYSLGSQGEWPGAMWNVHGMSVDQDGNLYLAEVNNGRPQKFRPRAGANRVAARRTTCQGGVVNDEVRGSKIRSSKWELI